MPLFCREFAQNEGNFSKCKNVLEKCPESNKLLERLSKLNAKLASSCPEGMFNDVVFLEHIII